MTQDYYYKGKLTERAFKDGEKIEVVILTT